MSNQNSNELLEYVNNYLSNLINLIKKIDSRKKK